ncbi:MAG TPA: DUF1553 domain-containing protein [Pirellulales bacterium]|nr:DUF1553 domain-containing protein [Pirellulales bacterium]
MIARGLFSPTLLLLAIAGAVQPVYAESPTGDGASAKQDLWSFQPVRPVLPPMLSPSESIESPVDSFILARLTEHGLPLSDPTEKRTLLRRATFDLTGLPPTPEETEAFLADDSPAAFERVIDRLLASPRYGQRWARHWLDVVRYADARDLIQLPAESDFREIWRYRDWVVNAFNGDLPYDEFVRRQIAGDLLQPTDPARIDADSLVATGFLALADFVPGDVDKELMVADCVNDQLDVMGRAVLGLTLGCARCHDHKFDPISMRDYYSLAGIFFSTRLIPGPVAGNTPLVRVPLLSSVELQAIEAETARTKSRIAQLTTEIPTTAAREYRLSMEKLVLDETPRYLFAVWEYRHSDESRPDAPKYAADRGLDPSRFAKWLTYVQDRTHPAIAPLTSIEDRAAAESRVGELHRDLASVAARRGAAEGGSPVQEGADTELLALRADDPRLVVGQDGQVTIWPDRAGVADDAAVVADQVAPRLMTATICGHSRPVLKFQGQETLQSPCTVPAVGSLFVVFRPDANSEGGQRLVGWEDSSVGRHGLGVMPDAAGAFQGILRCDGSGGDVMVAAPPAPEFQLVTLTWGPSGVEAYRDGTLVATNKTIQAVSSDPQITALHIGGPGSGTAARFRGELAELRVYAAPLGTAKRNQVEAELRQRWFEADPLAEIPVDPIVDLYQEILSPRGPYWVAEADRAALLPADARFRLDQLQAELEILKSKTTPEIPRAVVVQEGGPTGTRHEGFHDAQIYIRGKPTNLGPTVPRGFPRRLAGDNQRPITEGSGRRQLAEWLVSPDNPLTARVMVNRIWQHHFGQGLVRTSANFGARGERPSHPELLDYLADRFVAAGWSVKAMHRLIMLSRVYRQNSRADERALATDPENRLLAYMPRRRLEAEEIRDSLLAVANRLDSTAGGPGFLELATPRRSLYLMSVRTGAKTADFGPLFDGADCSAVVERRNQSTVAPQALFLMNDPFVLDLAAALSERILRDVSEEDQSRRIDRLYQIVLGRPPTPAEIDIGQRLLEESVGTDGWTRYCHVMLCTNEFVYVD